VVCRIESGVGASMARRNRRLLHSAADGVYRAFEWNVVCASARTSCLGVCAAAPSLPINHSETNEHNAFNSVSAASRGSSIVSMLLHKKPRCRELLGV